MTAAEHRWRHQCPACRERRNAATRAQRARNREAIAARRSVQLAAKYADRRDRMVAYLGGACDACGSSELLQIDHRDPTHKQYALSNMSQWSWERVLVELAKCHLLCWPCHLRKASVYLLVDGTERTIPDLQRRSSPEMAGALWQGWLIQAPASVCAVGHPFDELNTGYHGRTRICRICTNEKQRRAYARRAVHLAGVAA